MRKSATITTAFLLSLLWADSAFAFSFWDCIPEQVPEIDAASGLATLALIMSIGAVIHRKIRD
jgi:hypothetical protein